jgi:hypothetical protein
VTKIERHLAHRIRQLSKARRERYDEWPEGCPDQEAERDIAAYDFAIAELSAIAAKLQEGKL